MLDNETKNKINNLINNKFLINVFLVNENEHKPSIILNNQLKDGNIFRYIKTYHGIIEKYYPKDIKAERSLEKIKKMEVNEKNTNPKDLYLTKAFTKEKEEKSSYQLFLTEMSKFVNFNIEIDDKLFKKISGYSYSDLTEDSIAKPFLKNMRLDFAINVNSDIGLRLLNKGGDLSFFDYLYKNKEFKNIETLKNIEKEKQEKTKKLQSYILNNISL